MDLTSRDEYLPLTYFDKVYLVDLCEPLLEVARARCKQKGWKNVVCLCQDASRFVLPEWESGELDPKESLSVITMSYSLSMVCLFCDHVQSSFARSHPSTSSWIGATKSLTRKPV